MATALSRRVSPSVEPHRLHPDDVDRLRHAASLACHVLHLIVEGAGAKETRRAAFALADELGTWHRNVEPAIYGRQPGHRP